MLDSPPFQKSAALGKCTITTLHTYRHKNIVMGILFQKNDMWIENKSLLEITHRWCKFESPSAVSKPWNILEVWWLLYWLLKGITYEKLHHTFLTLAERQEAYTSKTSNKYTPTPTNTLAALRLQKGCNKTLTNSRRQGFLQQVWAPRWIISLWHLTFSFPGGSSIEHNIHEEIPICTSIQAQRFSHLVSDTRPPEKTHDGM